MAPFTAACCPKVTDSMRTLLDMAACVNVLPNMAGALLDVKKALHGLRYSMDTDAPAKC